MRVVALLGMWLAATAVAVAVAWGGVQLVARQVVDPIPLAIGRDARTSTAAPATPAPGTLPERRPTADSPADPTPAAATAELRTYQLQGGTVSVSFSPQAVTVLQATPHSGYVRTVEPEGSGVKVEFRSQSHRSRLDVWWDAVPQARTREDPRD